MAREPRWVPRVVVESVHFDQIREHGGMPGLRDEAALETALARPRHKWSYASHPDLATLGAAYAFGLAKAHAFHDGNKRVAFVTLVVFLGLNGKTINATEAEVVQVMTALAASSLREASLARWLRDRLVPLTQ